MENPFDGSAAVIQWLSARFKWTAEGTRLMVPVIGVGAQSPRLSYELLDRVEDVLLEILNGHVLVQWKGLPSCRLY